MSKKIYVGNLSFKATENELRNAFSEFGIVDSVNIITDRETGRCRGFGFVEMSSSEEANMCISQLNAKEFMGRELRVNIASPQKERPRMMNRY